MKAHSERGRETRSPGRDSKKNPASEHTEVLGQGIHRVTPATVSEQVADQLRDLIGSGRLQPGDRLPSERELAERFGVGRPAVREALRELKAQGLVSAGRGPKGTVITEMPGSDISAPLAGLLGKGAERLLDLMELRIAVEVQAAGLAARRATLEDLRRLSGIEIRPYDSGLAESDIAFHRGIAEASHNGLLRQLSQDIVDLLHEHMPAILHVIYTQPGGAGAVQRQHDMVLGAIRRGDEEAARKAMRDHLSYVTRGLMQLAGSGPSIRLVIMDLDGTLLAGPRHISDHTKEAITLVREAGAELVIASARPPRSVRRYHEELELITPIIACNGALLWDLVANVPLSRVPLRHELVEEMVTIGRELGTIVNLESEDEWFADRVNDRILENIERYGVAPPKQVGTIDEVLSQARPVDQVFMDLRDLDLEAQDTARVTLSRIFSGHANVTETVPGLVDFVAAEASKASMAQQLARSMGIAAEQVLAIGDHDNDVSLLQWAGVGVAMGNATPAAKAAADAVTSSNLREGVAEALDRWVLDQLGAPRSR